MLIEQGAAQQAVIVYQQSLVADPDNAVVYMNLAYAYEKLGETKLAVNALLQAVRRGDTTLQGRAYFNLGNLYFRQGQYEEAINAYQESLVLVPSEDTRYNLELALLYRQQPTPTPLELQTRAELGQADPLATPTPNPSNAQPPTPTPAPEIPSGDPPENIGFEGERDDNYRTTPLPSAQGTLTVQQALEILDDVEPERDDLPGMFREITPFPSTPFLGKDW
jgi:tetratricopeptide (TPR) repeat protein